MTHLPKQDLQVQDPQAMGSRDRNRFGNISQAIFRKSDQCPQQYNEFEFKNEQEGHKTNQKVAGVKYLPQGVVKKGIDTAKAAGEGQENCPNRNVFTFGKTRKHDTALLFNKIKASHESSLQNGQHSEVGEGVELQESEVLFQKRTSQHSNYSDVTPGNLFSSPFKDQQLSEKGIMV